jgi:hypothetical protein
MRSRQTLSRIAHISATAAAIIFIASLASAQAFQDFFDDSQIVIVTGTHAAASDNQAAQRVSNLIEDEIAPVRKIRIMTDSDINAYVGSLINGGNGLPTDIRIISIGGSCVNGLSAVILELGFPTCDDEFRREVSTGPGEYLVQTERMSAIGDNELTVTVIAGYDAAETLYGASKLDSGEIDYGIGRSNVVDMSDN